MLVVQEKGTLINLIRGVDDRIRPRIVRIDPNITIIEMIQELIITKPTTIK